MAFGEVIISKLCTATRTDLKRRGSRTVSWRFSQAEKATYRAKILGVIDG